MVFWQIIAAILAVIAVLILVALLFPVIIDISSVRSEGRIEGSLRISWAMLLVRYSLKDRQTEIFIFGRRVVSELHKEKPPEKVKAKKLKKIKPSRKMPPIGDIVSLARPMLRLFKDLVNAFRLKYFDVDVTFGLDDPAYTGIMTGALHAIQGSSRIYAVKWSPDFTKEVLDWNVRAKVSIVPIQAVPPVARFVTSGQVLRAGWGIIRGH